MSTIGETVNHFLSLPLTKKAEKINVEGTVDRIGPILLENFKGYAILLRNSSEVYIFHTSTDDLAVSFSLTQPGDKVSFLVASSGQAETVSFKNKSFDLRGANGKYFADPMHPPTQKMPPED